MGLPLSTVVAPPPSPPPLTPVQPVFAPWEWEMTLVPVMLAIAAVVVGLLAWRLRRRGWWGWVAVLAVAAVGWLHGPGVIHRRCVEQEPLRRALVPTSALILAFDWLGENGHAWLADRLAQGTCGNPPPYPYPWLLGPTIPPIPPYLPSSATDYDLSSAPWILRPHVNDPSLHSWQWRSLVASVKEAGASARVQDRAVAVVYAADLMDRAPELQQLILDRLDDRDPCIRGLAMAALMTAPDESVRTEGGKRVRRRLDDPKAAWVEGERRVAQDAVRDLEPKP